LPAHFPRAALAGAPARPCLELECLSHYRLHETKEGPRGPWIDGGETPSA
jgi:hypothetical protein